MAVISVSEHADVNPTLQKAQKAGSCEDRANSMSAERPPGELLDQHVCDLRERMELEALYPAVMRELDSQVGPRFYVYNGRQKVEATWQGTLGAIDFGLTGLRITAAEFVGLRAVPLRSTSVSSTTPPAADPSEVAPRRTARSMLRNFLHSTTRSPVHSAPNEPAVVGMNGGAALARGSVPGVGSAPGVLNGNPGAKHGAGNTPHNQITLDSSTYQQHHFFQGHHQRKFLEQQGQPGSGGHPGSGQPGSGQAHHSGPPLANGGGGDHRASAGGQHGEDSSHQGGGEAGPPGGPSSNQGAPEGRRRGFSAPLSSYGGGSRAALDTWEIVWKEAKGKRAIRRLKFETNAAGYELVCTVIASWAEAAHSTTILNEAARAALEACGGSIKENAPATSAAAPPRAPGFDEQDLGLHEEGSRWFSNAYSTDRGDEASRPAGGGAAGGGGVDEATHAGGGASSAGAGGTVPGGSGARSAVNIGGVIAVNGVSVVGGGSHGVGLPGAGNRGSSASAPGQGQHHRATATAVGEHEVEKMFELSLVAPGGAIAGAERGEHAPAKPPAPLLRAQGGSVGLPSGAPLGGGNLNHGISPREVAKAAAEILERAGQGDLVSPKPPVAENVISWGSVMLEGKYLPVKDGQSLMLKDAHIKALAAALPARLRTLTWVLQYSTHRDGISLSTLYRKVHKKGPVLLVARDRQQHVFGCFTSEEWRVAPRYYGNGECFVFQVQPELKAYRWTRANSYFMFSTSSLLAIGGGGHYAMLLNSDLLTGYSGISETFGNESLSGSEEFELLHLEVWSFR
eukprot:jgi/Mesen1/8070/ME000433S07369